MTGGADLLGGAVEKRKRGRPKGSTNKRQLGGLVASLYGGTTAQQVARACLVTPKELRAAGGDMAAANVAKAVRLVDLAREAQQGLMEQLVRLVELAAAAGSIEKDRAREKALGEVVDRILARAEPVSLAQAMKLLDDQRAALLPYTDQRQAQAVQVQHEGLAPPIAVLMGGPSPDQPQSLGQQGFGGMVIPGVAVEVTGPKSPEPEQGLIS